MTGCHTYAYRNHLDVFGYKVDAGKIVNTSTSGQIECAKVYLPPSMVDVRAFEDTDRYSREAKEEGDNRPLGRGPCSILDPTLMLPTPTHPEGSVPVIRLDDTNTFHNHRLAT